MYEKIETKKELKDLIDKGIDSFMYKDRNYIIDIDGNCLYESFEDYNICRCGFITGARKAPIVSRIWEVIKY